MYKGILQMNNMGAPKGKYKRWHRFREDDTKEMKSFKIGIDPTTSNIEPGYKTNWIVGAGPISEQTYQSLMKVINEKVRNIPKSEETKRKMRIAKLGIPKSPQHRENMRIARLKVLARQGK